MSKSSGAPVPRGAYEGHLNDDWKRAHGIFAGVKAGGYVVTQQAWIAPTLGNSWVNYDAASYSAAGYFRDTLGIVHLRGILKGGTLTSAAFTLPAGYRPAKIEYHAVVSNGAFGFCVVSSNGQVIPWVGNNAAFSLDGITFRAA